MTIEQLVGGVRMFLLIIGAVLAQVAVVSQFRSSWFVADLALLTGLGVALVGGPERGAVAGFFSGVLYDLFLQTPFGLSGLAYAIAAYALGEAVISMSRTAGWIPKHLGVAAASLGALSLWVMVGLVLGQTQVLDVTTVTAAGAIAVSSLVMTRPAAAAARWAVGPDFEDLDDR